MGRRAKNKQSAPEALEPKIFPTSKKLGKRKADSDDVDRKSNSRPTKKIKELDGKGKQKSLSKGKTRTVENLSDEDEDLGWEAVEAKVDLMTKLDDRFFSSLIWVLTGFLF
jgi:25S rRNA (cytosine2870-C5)-methyltransferase